MTASKNLVVSLHVPARAQQLDNFPDCFAAFARADRARLFRIEKIVESNGHTIGRGLIGLTRQTELSNYPDTRGN